MGKLFSFFNPIFASQSLIIHVLPNPAPCLCPHGCSFLRAVNTTCWPTLRLRCFALPQATRQTEKLFFLPANYQIFRIFASQNYSGISLSKAVYSAINEIINPSGTLPQNNNVDTMNYQRTLRIYEWISYILIIGATVAYFFLHSRGAWALNLTLCILVLAIFCRLMMERTRRLAADAENDQLKDDLRRLTQLYAEEKKKNA